MIESGKTHGRRRGFATMCALILLLVMLVGLIGYQLEERLGGFAYFLAEAIASVVVIGLIAWTAYRSKRS
jgi:divalent metal cation (Fe/Co/Zn/Cd) transporter